MAAGSEASSSQPLLRAVLLEQARHLSVTEALLTCRAQGMLQARVPAVQVHRCSALPASTPDSDSVA